MKIEQARESICEIGRQIYAKSLVAANEGNLSIRIDEYRVLCTPTLVSKGFLKPEDLCIVHISGKQLEGIRKPTSEILLHLEIYRQRPDVRSVVHTHPPHATAFAVAREPIPVCILPEPDIFLGEVPIAPYETPGTQKFADTILPLVKKTNAIVLANHGTVTYEAELQTAYWMTEILDAYCRILINARQLGHVQQLSRQQGCELLELRKAWGFRDLRWKHRKGIDVRDHVLFKSTWEKFGLQQRAFGQTNSPASSPLGESDMEQLIERIADRVVQKLNQEK